MNHPKIIEPKPPPDYMGPRSFVCSGKCGVGEICAERVYKNGYCLDPAAREAVINGALSVFCSKTSV